MLIYINVQGLYSINFLIFLCSYIVSSEGEKKNKKAVGLNCVGLFSYLFF